MKLLLSPATFLVVSSTLLAQGTFRASNNYIPPGKTDKAFITGVDGIRPLDRTLGRIRIRSAGPGSPILTPNGESGIPLLLDGLFFTSDLVVPGIPVGGSANVILEVWQSTREWVGSVICGSVLVRISNLGGGDIPPATFRDNSDFVGAQAHWQYPGYVILFPPSRAPDGTLEILGASDSAWLADLYASTNMTDWAFVKKDWVSGFGFFPPPRGTFRLSLPPELSSQHFKIVW